MRKIAKGQPPASVAGRPPPRSWLQERDALAEDLAEAQRSNTRRERLVEIARGRFDGLDKAVVRRALGAEQSSLCVFCESEIDPEHGPVEEPVRGVRIAHWRPLSSDPLGALDWRNAYASCTGVRDSGAVTCDEAQKDTDPNLEPPAKRDWSTQLEFGSDGSMRTRPGAPAALTEAIGENVWNLNNLSLVAARRRAMDTEKELARAERDHRRSPKSKVIDRRLKILDRTPPPFVTSVRQALERWR